MPVRPIRRERGKADHASGLFRLHLVDDALLSVHQRHQFTEHHAADRCQITLPLQHSCKPGKIGLQPVLFRVALRRKAEVVDHGVDVVFEFGDFAAGFHLN